MTIYIYKKQKRHTSALTDKFIKESLSKHFGADNGFVLKRTPLGKPYIDENKAFLSVTHTDDTLIIAIDKMADFGIDAEDENRKISRCKALCEKYFSDAEKNYVSKANFDAKSFLEIWTKKEAYVKYLGTGISDISKCDTFSQSGHFLKINYENLIIHIYCKNLIEEYKIVK